MYLDLREFIAQVDDLGLLQHAEGADPHLEIGGVTEVASIRPECPVLLFDAIKGYPRGFRVLTNFAYSMRASALALGIDPDLPPLDAVKAWKVKREALQPLPPTLVNKAAFLENSMRGPEVDLDRFPIPRWHEHDGGPYIGTASLVVTRDLNSDWVNTAIYRIQKHSKNRVTVQFDHRGRHGAMIAQKYWNAGRSCPIAIVCGQDPALFFAGNEALPQGQSEYEIAGGLKGTPLEVFPGPETGIPIPAHAEIILEGQLLPPSQETLIEGPFGERTGYYAGESQPCPVMEVTAIHYRNDPILLGAPPLKPPRRHFGGFRAVHLWGQLEAAGVTDVTGVWPHVSGLMLVIAIKQRYAGHAKRAGLIAAANGYMCRLIVVVDDDIDISNLDDVMWAVATRCEASEAVDIVRNAWSSHLDPRISPEDKARGATSHSKMIIEACWPFSWKDNVPTATAVSADTARKIVQKWSNMLDGKSKTANNA